MIDPARTCLYIPPELKKFKLELFNRIALRLKQLGGKSTGEQGKIEALPDEIIPIVGCSPQLTPVIQQWMLRGRTFIYWDRGYARRVFATWLPRGASGGYYRWHVNCYQLQKLREVPADRWSALQIPLQAWNKGGKHIVLARPSTTYMRFHQVEHWVDKTIYDLSLLTERQLVVRDKESKRHLGLDLQGAHCLVTHGSIAAVEAVIMGCPVFVDPCSAAALVGKTDLKDIERPIYPDRTQWVHNLAYCQFNEQELVNGTLWQLLE